MLNTNVGVTEGLSLGSGSLPNTAGGQLAITTRHVLMLVQSLVQYSRERQISPVLPLSSPVPLGEHRTAHF